MIYKNHFTIMCKKITKKQMKKVLIVMLFLLFVYTNADENNPDNILNNNILNNNILNNHDNVKSIKHEIKIITKEEFKDMNSKLESRGRYNISNRFKYVGKYQFGKIALLELGYDEEWIDSLQSSVYFELNSKGKKRWFFDIKIFPPREQEKAICKYYHKIEKRYMKKDIKKYVGKKIDGVYITKAGIIGASMFGCGNVHKFLESNGNVNFRDGNSVSVKSRLVHFQNVELKECF